MSPESTSGIQMVNHIIWITLVVTLQVSAVFCRNPYFEYFYSRYHEGHSTTESISSSTSDISSEEVARSSVSDTSLRETSASSSTGGSFSENLMHSSTVDHRTTSQSSISVLQYGERHKHHHIFISRIGLVVGSIIAFLCIIGVIVCCCPKCCRGTDHRDYVRRNGIETASEVQAQQPVLVPYSQQPVAVQQLPPHYGCIPQYPPQYQSHLIQQQYQYSAGQPQFYNLPEAPPPYEYPPNY